MCLSCDWSVSAHMTPILSSDWPPRKCCVLIGCWLMISDKRGKQNMWRWFTEGSAGQIIKNQHHHYLLLVSHTQLTINQRNQRWAACNEQEKIFSCFLMNLLQFILEQFQWSKITSLPQKTLSLGFINDQRQFSIFIMKLSEDVVPGYIN